MKCINGDECPVHEGVDICCKQCPELCTCMESCTVENRIKCNLDMSMKLFMKIADMAELCGAHTSVCDNCERTYPLDWVETCGGICPFCGLEHTNKEE
jgi:hypothetical protein